MRPLILLAVFAAIAHPVRAQQQPTGVGDPFASFMRVAGTVDEPVAALRKIWPVPINGGRAQPTLLLTAAHRVMVDLGERSPLRDTATYVSSATFSERIADSASLRERVQRLVEEISRDSGPPDRCTDPLGSPAFLFAPQEVTRIWSRGIRGKATRLIWSVSPGGLYELTVRIGRLTDPLSETLPCDARMP